MTRMELAIRELPEERRDQVYELLEKALACRELTSPLPRKYLNDIAREFDEELWSVPYQLAEVNV